MAAFSTLCIVAALALEILAVDKMPAEAVAVLMKLSVRSWLERWSTTATVDVEAEDVRCMYPDRLSDESEASKLPEVAEARWLP